ncbi:MAG: hypothetical protein U0525_00070 [Patescibacteria group bacterium]
MNRNFYKVNTRYITLLAFVLIIIFQKQSFAANIIPTDPPETRVPTPTLSSADYNLEPEEQKFIEDSRTGARNNYEQQTNETKKAGSNLIDIFMQAIGGAKSLMPTLFPTATPTPSPTPSDGSNPPCG